MNEIDKNTLLLNGFIEAKYFNNNIRPDSYYINNDGRIYSIISNSFIKNRLDKNGYYRVTLCDKNNNPKHYLIHRLVAYTFLGEPNFENAEVDHINRDRTNNNILNLRYLTQIDNLNNRDTKNIIRLNPSKVHDICISLQNHDYETLDELANRYNVNRTTISDIKRGHTWKNISDLYDIKTTRQSEYLKDEVVHNICKDLMNNNDIKFIAYKYNVSTSVIKSILNYRSYYKISSLYNFNRNKNTDTDIRSNILFAYKLGIPAKDIRSTTTKVYLMYAKYMKQNEYPDYTFTNTELTDDNQFSDEVSILNIDSNSENELLNRLRSVKPVTDEIVVNICKDLSLHNYKRLSDLAKKYNTTNEVIYDIKMGRNYKNISSQFDINREKDISSVCQKETILKIAKDIMESRKNCYYDEPKLKLSDIANKYNVTETLVKQIASKKLYSNLTKDYDFGLTQKERRENRKNLVFKLLDFNLSINEISEFLVNCLSKNMIKNYKTLYNKSNDDSYKYKMCKKEISCLDINDSDNNKFTDYYD